MRKEDELTEKMVKAGRAAREATLRLDRARAEQGKWHREASLAEQDWSVKQRALETAKDEWLKSLVVDPPAAKLSVVKPRAQE